MQALIVVLFGRPIRWWPILRTWRAKLGLGLGLLLSSLLYPIVSLACHFPVWVSVVWGPCLLLFGWLSGRLIGEAAIQRGEERAAAHLKDMGYGDS